MLRVSNSHKNEWIILPKTSELIDSNVDWDTKAKSIASKINVFFSAFLSPLDLVIYTEIEA